jgi:hypothetical protein
MIITKKALSRRTFLRGAGTVLALPLLDAMIPSMTALAETPAAPERLRRLGYVYIPMGCDGSRWTPAGGERLDELSFILAPLAPVKQHVSVLGNLELRNAYPGTHATSNSAFLSAARAKLTDSAVDGPDDARRAVRQRLRLRLSQLPLVVLADDAASERGSSADRVRATFRRRDDRRGTPGLSKESSQLARFGEG